MLQNDQRTVTPVPNSTRSSSDARTLQVSFDASQLSPGPWSLIVTTATEFSSYPITVAETKPPNIVATITGPRRVLIGERAGFLVRVCNDGTVDAGPTPITIAGIPVHATFEAAFPVADRPSTPANVASLPLDWQSGQTRIVPLLLPDVPPGCSRVLPFWLTMNADDLIVGGGVTSAQVSVDLPSSSPNSAGTAEAYDPEAIRECIAQMGSSMFSLMATGLEQLIPGNDCVEAVAGFIDGSVVDTGIHDALSMPREGLMNAENGYGLAITAGQCVAGFIPGLSEIGDAIEIGDAAVQNALMSAACAKDAAAGVGFVFPGSFDPNGIIGPGSGGSQNWVDARAKQPYTVTFENAASAALPAQTVQVDVPLDATTMDLATFEVGPITVGGRTVSPPPGQVAYTSVLDLRPDEQFGVRIDARLDAAKSKFVCTFATVDPDTFEPVSDNLVGFLPPDVVPPQGEGSVSFGFRAVAGVAHGTTLSVQAGIMFDTNPPLPTASWITTIDAHPPVSQIGSLSGTSSSVQVSIPWSATDDGAGVAHVELLVSVDGQPFYVESQALTEPVISFIGDPGRSYRFMTLAQDAAGLRESLDVTRARQVTIASTAKVAKCGNRRVTIRGSGIILGTNGKDVILGSAGADMIFGLGGNDIICGGSGDDVIFGGEGNDRIFGQGGNDTIHGGPGRDRIDGGDGDDFLYGDADNDLLIGGAGDDTLDGGTGHDRLNGGSGNNICFIESQSDARPQACQIAKNQ
jgi:hypothetical protein